MLHHVFWSHQFIAHVIFHSSIRLPTELISKFQASLATPCIPSSLPSLPLLPAYTCVRLFLKLLLIPHPVTPENLHRWLMLLLSLSCYPSLMVMMSEGKSWCTTECSCHEMAPSLLHTEHVSWGPECILWSISCLGWLTRWAWHFLTRTGNLQCWILGFVCW